MKKFGKKFSLFRLVLALAVILPGIGAGYPDAGYQWGFWSHKHINRLAVFRLPVEMIGFYKSNIDYLTENAVNPDKRRYAVVGEAERHYIDLDVYGLQACQQLPRSWNLAVDLLGEDSLRKHGIVPWQIQLSAYQLTQAFKERDAQRILRVSADLGHYIGDAHVPLHTTRNYNGQLSGQDGIHGFWESRLPELFASEFILWNEPVQYVPDISKEAWRIVGESHAACDSVLAFEKILSGKFKAEEKYSYELRNNILTKSYSREFSKKYAQMVNGQVERRMKASIKMVGDIWYTCWINAGQPDINSLKADMNAQKNRGQEEESKLPDWLRSILPVRPEPD